MKLKKYRCIVRSLLGASKETTTFFFAKSEQEARGRVVIFLQMWLGISFRAETIKVSYEPSVLPGNDSNIVTASIEVSENRIPVLTAFVVLESDYQALLEQDGWVTALEDLETDAV